MRHSENPCASGIRALLAFMFAESEPGDARAIREKIARLAGHLLPPCPPTAQKQACQAVAVGDRAAASSVDTVEQRTALGRFWHRSCTYDPRDPWGELIPDVFCPGLAGATLRIPFDGSGERIPITDCLFVDCETTGLSGGVGTVAFLTAVGRLTDHGFVVDQFFLPELADEVAVLDVLAKRFAGAAALVTYNGAAFDLPLLESRFRFCRREPAFRDIPHLDLLWPTRAVFRRRIHECSLASVEAHLLKLARIGDLPGAEVPEVYFQFLRYGHSPRLHDVFEHNRMDVVSLFVYALWLDRQTAPEQPLLSDPEDLLSLARYWFRRPACGGLTAAHVALDAAGRRVLDPSQRACLSELRGRILKREQRYEDAHSQWERLADCDPDRFEAVEELAKHLEHRRRDFTGALKVVDTALERLHILETFRGLEYDFARQCLRHRRERLLRRINRERVRQSKSIVM